MIKMNPHLKEFWSKYSPIKLLYGGRDSSKTKDTAIWLTIQSSNYKLRIMCARQFQSRVTQSVYTEIKWAIEELKLGSMFKINNNSIINLKTGSEFFFYGISRNLSDIKGTADIDILWIEEGEDLSQPQFEAIEPTVRKEGSMIIILFNPQLETDYVWSSLVLSKRKDIQKRHINYNENPFLSNKSRDRILVMKNEDRDSYDHIYRGEPKKDDEGSIIKRKWLLACIDSHIKLNINPRGGKRIGYDVADDGKDTNAMAIVDGGLLYHLEEWHGGEDELFESSERVYQKAVNDRASINYDANGVGAGVGSNVNKLNRESIYNITATGFNSANSPLEPDSLYGVGGEDSNTTNSEYFENIKAQSWWLFADRVKATYRAVELKKDIDIDNVVSFDSDLENIKALIMQLSTPRKKQSGRLKNMVEKKTDLLKRGISSPNLADAVIMAYANIDDNSYLLDALKD